MTITTHPNPSKASIMPPDMATSAESSEAIELRQRVQVQSHMPIEQALQEAIQHHSHAIDVVDLEAELSRAELDAIHAQPSEQAEAEYEPAKLDQVMQQYLREEKNFVPDNTKALHFVQEQVSQHRLPKDEQDWTLTNALYKDMIGQDEEKFPKTRKAWASAASFYAMSAHLMTFLSIVPAIITLCKSEEELKNDASHLANQNMSMQISFALAAPFINAALQIIMVAMQELKQQGYSNRSTEMKAPPYPKLKASMNSDSESMKALTEELDALALRADSYIERHEELPAALLDEIRDAADRVSDVEKHSHALEEKLDVRKGVVNLNYVSQPNQSLNRLLGVLGKLGASVAGTMTHNSKVTAGTQVFFGALNMILHQTYTVRQDFDNKHMATIEATAKATKLIRAEAQHKPADELTIADLDLSDVPAQWKGPMSVAVDHVNEYLDYNVKYKEQELAEQLDLSISEWRTYKQISDLPDTARSAEQVTELNTLTGKMKTLTAGSDEHEKYSKGLAELDVLKNDKNILSNADGTTIKWTDMSEENQKILFDAINPDQEGMKTFRTALRTALVRMQLSSDLIPQIAQRFGSSFQLVVGGSNMPLVVNAIIRKLAAEGVDLPTSARIGIYSAFAVIGIAGAYSGGPLINTKISQRNELRAKAKENPDDQVGFTPTLAKTGEALAAIGKAMVAVPRSAYDRITVDQSAKAMRAQRDKMLESMAKQPLLPMLPE